MDQKILVAEAIGDKSVGLEDDVTIRRRDNYSKFFVQDSDDGGYRLCGYIGWVIDPSLLQWAIMWIRREMLAVWHSVRAREV